MRNQADFAISLILNSTLQIALALTPLLVLLSNFIGGAHLTLVLSPLLIAALGLSAILDAFVVYDGESTWLEGAALVGLYIIIAASFWWDRTSLCNSATPPFNPYAGYLGTGYSRTVFGQSLPVTTGACLAGRQAMPLSTSTGRWRSAGP